MTHATDAEVRALGRKGFIVVTMPKCSVDTEAGKAGIVHVFDLDRMQEVELCTMVDCELGVAEIIVLATDERLFPRRILRGRFVLACAREDVEKVERWTSIVLPESMVK